jgi:hypothetical protein
MGERMTEAEKTEKIREGQELCEIFHNLLFPYTKNRRLSVNYH